MEPARPSLVAVSSHQIIGFALAAFAIIIIPGPSVLFTVSRGVALGRAAALATVLGNTMGALMLSFLVAFGLGGIVTKSLVIFTIVKFVGAAYLMFLGVQMWRHRRELPASLRGEVAPRPVRRIIREGFVVGATNPKVVVFFAAVLPQFVDRNGASVSVQMAVLGLVFAGIALVSDSAWGLAAGTARGWFTQRPNRLERIGGLGGLTIVALGVRVAVTGRHD